MTKTELTSGETGPSDSELVVRTRNGDRLAFSILINRYNTPIIRFLSSQLRNPEEAYDAAQETFVAVYRNLARYDPDKPFKTWLYFIARNKARDALRKRRALRWVGGDEQFETLETDTPDPSQEVEGREELALVKQAIFTLPEGLRTPLLLTAEEGFSQKEIGQAMGITPKAVEQRVYRARKALAKLLLDKM